MESTRTTPLYIWPWIVTVSVALIQYNNTAITTSSTIYGNVGSVNASTVTEVQSLADTSLQDGAEDIHYTATPIVFGNGTGG